MSTPEENISPFQPDPDLALFADPPEEETPEPTSEQVEEPSASGAEEPVETPAEEEATPSEAAEPPEAEPGEAPEAESPPEAEVDWKKRYDDGKRAYDERITAERVRREQAERVLADMIAQKQGPAPALPEDQVEVFTRRAEELGMEGEQAKWFVDVASQMAAAASEATRQQVLQSQIDLGRRAELSATEAAVEAQSNELAKAFVEAHRADITPEVGQAMLDILRDIGALEDVQFTDGSTRPLPVKNDDGLRVLYPEALEISLEAAKNAALRQVLIAIPDLYRTDEGIEMARRLAGTPQVAASVPVDTQAAEEAVRAAQSLPAGSGGGPGAGRKSGDIIAELEAFAEQQGADPFARRG